MNGRNESAEKCASVDRTEEGGSLIETTVRGYFTTLLWYEDRLSSVRTRWLLTLTLLALAVLGLLAAGLFNFLEDVIFLVGENDLKTVLIAGLFILAVGTVVWVLASCIWALSRKILLRLRGL